MGGEHAMSALRPLLLDRSLEWDYTSDGVRYPVCDAAARVLRERGRPAPEGSTRPANSPEGRAMVREALASPDKDTRKAGLKAAGKTEDKSLIPLVRRILDREPDLAREAAAP